jgi:hypothetical protein
LLFLPILGLYCISKRKMQTNCIPCFLSVKWIRFVILAFIARLSIKVGI